MTLELGGKSPNIALADADLERAADWGVRRVMANSGQTCSAPTRMLVEKSVYDKVVDLAVGVGRSIDTGDPARPGDHIGPVVSKAQFDKIQDYIQKGLTRACRQFWEASGGLTMQIGAITSAPPFSPMSITT